MKRWTRSVSLHLSRLTVRGDVDLVWQLGHVDLEAVLHVVQSLGVSLVWHEGYGQTFGSKPAGAGNLTRAEQHKNQTCYTISERQSYTEVMAKNTKQTSVISLPLFLPCADRCQNLLACRSWRRCSLARCPSLDQTGSWPPRSASGSPWTADSETAWGGGHLDRGRKTIMKTAAVAINRLMGPQAP